MADLLTADGIERLHEAALNHVGDDRVPGLVALVARGEQVHVETLGTLSVGGAPVARDSLFRIASTTKPITAAATLAVAGEGLIDIDEPVDRLLPELAGPRVLARIDGPLDETVPAHRPITARDLLTFTFGFGMAHGDVHLARTAAGGHRGRRAAARDIRAAGPGRAARSRHLDRGSRLAAAASAAGRTLALQHRGIRPRRAARARRRPAAGRRAADTRLRAARHARHGLLDGADRPAGHLVRCHAGRSRQPR